MDSLGGGAAVQSATSRRVLSSKQRAPPPPQKVMKCDPVDVEIQEDDVPRTFSAAHRKALLKQSRDQAKEPQALVFRKLDDQDQDSQAKAAEENKVPLAHAGEKLLATFYGMIYTNDGTEKEWRLEVDGFIPVCFVQVQGNANKPFRIIAVEKSKRIMEYQVNVNTTCARNSTFVKWQDGVSMFGVRCAKEEQAEQFLTTVKRMASTLNQTALLMKQPERQAAIRKMSDPSTSGIHHTKVSLMIKLPDKQTTVMSVPGLLTMSELFEMICEKEHLAPAEHQLSLPRTGTRKVTFDSGTPVGSLKIREVSIIRTISQDSSAASVEVNDESIEDLLDIEGEENKILQLSLPTGVRKSYRVSLDMTMKQLIMRVCSRESLNPRHHSLQYIDFKHEFLEASSTVDELRVNQIRLMDKRVSGRNILTITKSSVTDDDSPSNSPHNSQYRKSCSDEMEPVFSAISEGDKENKMTWQQRSKSLEGLADNKQSKAFLQQDGHMDLHKHSASNGSVPTSVRINSSESTTIKKLPPSRPLPYTPKSVSPPQHQSAIVPNGAVKEQSLSPIKKDGIMSASTPDLSTCSSRSDDSPVSSNDIKTSTPDTKSRRRAAPPPPPARPAVPKALFTEVKSEAQADGVGLPVKNNPPSVASSNASQAPEVKLKPSQKKRPAPPRPVRPAPPQPAPRVAKQGSLERKDVNGAERKEVSIQLKQDKEITSLDRASLSLDLETRHLGRQEEKGGSEEDDWRGTPIFIPPPPPDELPPPLDECETPVGPLTDFEEDFLEGSTNDGFPVTVNGFVGMKNIGMFAGRGVIDSQAQTIQVEEWQTDGGNAEIRYHPMLKARQKTALVTVPEQGYIAVVPPPPLYSEPESQPKTRQASSLADIPPPLLDTQTIQTSLEGDEKDHDSGFDQSPENLTITPPVDPPDDVPVERWEAPDSGSSLDVISAIPPPADFETRPLTPPCQFANPTMAPPVGFVNSEVDNKKVREPEKAKPRKTLNIGEGLFPWMNEPQAPVNATIPLEVSKDANDWKIITVNNQETTPVNDNSREISVSKDSIDTTTQPTAATVIVVQNATIATDVYSRPEKPARSKLNPEQNNNVSGKPEVNAKPTISEVATVEVKASVELPKSTSNDQSREIVSLQKTETKEVLTNDVIVINVNSMEEEQSGSKQVLNPIVKPVKPETVAKPVTFVKEAEVKVEPKVDVQQYALPSFTPFTEAAKPEPQVEPVKRVEQVKPEKPVATAKPVTFVQEAVVKVDDIQVNQQLTPIPPTEAVRPEPRVEPEKPETKAKPVTSVKEAEATVDVQQLTPLEATRPEAPAKPDPQVNPKKLEAKPVMFVKEIEVTVDIQLPAPMSFNSFTEAARPEPQVLPVKPDRQVKPVKPEAKESPVMFVKETEVKVDDIQLPAPASFNSFTEAAEPVLQVLPAKPDQQVKPVKPEAKPVTFVKEADVKVDVQQLGPSSFNPSREPAKPMPQVLPVKPDQQVKLAKPDQQVKLAIPEKPKTHPVEEVITPQSKPELKLCIKKVEQHDFPDGSFQKTHDKAACLETKPGDVAAPVQETLITVITINKENIVAEAPVTPETKPISCADDKLKDLEAKLQELDKEPASSTRDLGKLESMTAPIAHKEVQRKDVQTKDPFAEDVIVAETKQVEFSSNESFEVLFNMQNIKPAKEVTVIQHEEEKVERQPESSTTSHVEAKPELSLDLSSLRRSPEPPRPPSSSPPDGTPRSFTLPSPITPNSDRSTNSGFSPLEEPKGPSSPDSKLSGPSSLSNSAPDRTAAESQVSVTSVMQGNTNNMQTTSAPGKQHIAQRPSTFLKLQRPLSMPTGLLRDFKSNAVQEKSKLTKSDSRTSSSSDSTGISSPSPSSSPVDTSTTDPVDLPKPPPFTVPPLRRYSDLAADLSFISSAAKAAENKKANQSDAKPEVPPAKPSNPLLRRNPATAVERPRSWVGPETATKKRPAMWSSAFKPVSFDAQGKKGVRPVDFQIKSFTAPSTVPKDSSAANKTSTPSVPSEAPVIERLAAKQPEIEKPSKQAPLVPGKPSGISAGKPAAPVASSLARDEQSSIDQIQQPPVKTDSKVEKTLERTLSNPLTTKTDPAEKKYEIIYSNTPSAPQGTSKVNNDKTDSGSHVLSKDTTNAAALRDQIMRDQSSAHNKVTRGRPQSAFVGSSKFQILPANEKPSSNSGATWADAKKPAVVVQPKGVLKSDAVSWTHSKQQQQQQQQTNDCSKPDLPPQTTAKPQPQVKAAADSKPLPAVVTRTKTAHQDPTKRHSLPTYIIEGAERKQPFKTTGTGEAKFHFIMEDVKTDTTVVPGGIVAAMKALREKERAAKGD